MAKTGAMSRLIALIAWLTGVLVSLAVGFGMAQGTLSIPWLDAINAGIVAVVAGWIVIVLTILGVILAILNK